MVQAVWLRPDRLLLTIHHLAVDGVSWRILADDLAALLHGSLLPAHTTSFRRWAQQLILDAHRPERVKELSHWEDVLREPNEPLARRAPGAPGDSIADVRRFSLTLCSRLAAPLLSTVPAVCHGRISDVLLATFARAIAAWRERHGRGQGTSVSLDVESHGRDGLDLDSSRTVGWFTALYPVRLDPGSLDPVRALKQIKEQLRTVPDNGIGFGMLRYLNAETAPVLAALPTPEIGFNYLGRLVGRDAAVVDGDTAAGEFAPHALDLTALMIDGPEGPELTASWSWSPALLPEAEVRDLADAWFAELETLACEAARPGSSGLTPSDVPLVALTQEEIERLEGRHGALEDILPVTPLQRGLLFHALYDDTALDPYTVQLILGLDGPVDEAVLHARAEGLLRRHANLRGECPQLAQRRSLDVRRSRALQALGGTAGSRSCAALRSGRAAAAAVHTRTIRPRTLSASHRASSHAARRMVDAVACRGTAVGDGAAAAATVSRAPHMAARAGS
jgi:non-ribosomal peptide synthase protein (TIGR01720 family)